MANRNKFDPVVKKVSPYPIEASLTGGPAPAAIQILIVNTKGCMVNLLKNFVKLGGEYQVSFTLPVLKDAVVAKVKVMRTFDQFRPDSAGKKELMRMAEFHFVGLSDEARANITRFIQAIKQE